MTTHPSLSAGVRLRRWAWGVAAFAALCAATVACTPAIGDKCTVSTDCSVNGDRLCDVSQPDGYCTELNCARNGCADEAACVAFDSAIPGCGFTDRSGPGGSRVARSFCMKWCHANSDCRPGYICADSRGYPWNAIILDDNQEKHICVPDPLEGQDAAAAAPISSAANVCSPVGPTVTPVEAGAPHIFDAGGVTVTPLFDAGAPKDAAATD